MAKRTHIAVITVPAFSHQASIVEFCKRLVHYNPHFHVTCIFPTIDSPPPATITFLETLPSTINYTFLPPVNKQDLPQGGPPIVQLQIAVSQSMPSFRNKLRSLCSTTPLVALVCGSSARGALEVAKEFNLLSYVYYPTSAMTVSLLLHLPTLHEEISCEYRDHTEDIHIPGCVPIHGRDLPAHSQDRTSLAYELILERSRKISLADGVLINSFLELEGGIIRALQEQQGRGNTDIPLYLVGPIIQTVPTIEPNELECLRWLENQRSKSVLYVSFGSGGTVSQEQLNEIAFGLESSGKKFIWVLRAPSDSPYSAYLGAASDDPLKFLPQGFLERTKGQGLVIPSWAPQAQILSHSSTGGFLTHCGWNSILESIVVGVPMISWPLFAEQRMNAVWLTDGIKVALRPKFDENGIAKRVEIAKVIEELMESEEGKGIRQRIDVLKEAASDALKDGGSSIKDISLFSTRVEDFQR